MPPSLFTDVARGIDLICDSTGWRHGPHPLGAGRADLGELVCCRRCVEGTSSYDSIQSTYLRCSTCCSLIILLTRYVVALMWEEFDGDSKSYMFSLRGTRGTKLRLPKDDAMSRELLKNILTPIESLSCPFAILFLVGLVQPNLALSLRIPQGAHFSFEARCLPQWWHGADVQRDRQRGRPADARLLDGTPAYQCRRSGGPDCHERPPS